MYAGGLLFALAMRRLLPAAPTTATVATTAA
jgi:BASS family bile acid:Na+ symporter